jgi:radical SAM superfamily enzyme YgiQ (UPF0313 family)
LQQVTLVVPPRRRRLSREDAGEALGVEYLAAVLRRRGHRVRVYDATLLGWDTARLVRQVLTERPWLVGLSLVLPRMVREGIRLAALLRRAGYRGLVVAGGYTPSLAYREFLNQAAGVDAVVVGEGEATFAELVDRLRDGTDPTRVQVPGVACRGGDGSVQLLPGRALVDVDALPFPDRDLLPAVLARGEPAAVYSSRGCWARCSFCAVAAFYGLGSGPRWRGRSPENVVEELSCLVRDHGVTRVNFVDDNWVGPGEKGRQRAFALADLLERQPWRVEFMVSARPEDVEIELFRRLRQVGLRRVFLGVESGVQAALDRMGKGITVADNLRALRILEEVGLEAVPGFILFDPGTTLGELEANLAFLFRTGILSRSFNSRMDVLNRLEVYPGTPVEEELRTRGLLRGDYLDYWYPFADWRVALAYHVGRWAYRLSSLRRRR